jgi:transposase
LGMRTRGSASELERLRHLAVDAVLGGKTPVQVAEVLGVHPASVRKWWKAYQNNGSAGIASKPHPGRPPKLTPADQSRVLSWLRKSPKSFGFATELWTARRLAEVIERKLGVHFNHRYLNEWLTARGITPQKPAKQAREHDGVEIERWGGKDWRRIQNERAA